MGKYLDKNILAELAEDCKDFLPLRNRVFDKYGIDALDTDTLSSLEIYQIVSQYDPDYNVNFSRNGEDATSGTTKIEQKCTRVGDDVTKTGKPRKGAGTDASFSFHAMGDLEYPRYIFVARKKSNLEIVRLYDISKPENVAFIQAHLLQERQAWLDRGKQDPAKMKRDVILLPETLLLEKLAVTEALAISGCRVVRA